MTEPLESDRTPSPAPSTPEKPAFDVEGALSRMQEQINGIVEMLTNDRAERAASTERSPVASEPNTGSGDTPATEAEGPPTEEPDRRPNNAHPFFRKRWGK